MLFRARFDFSRCRCTTQCVLFAAPLYHGWMLLRWRLDLYRLDNFIGDRSENRKKSRGGKLKLLRRVLLEKVVVFERVEAAVAEQSMYIAEGLQFQQLL